MIKIETHLHTTYVSHCGWLGAQPLIRGYHEAGYRAIAVTDHYNRECFAYAGIDLTAPGDRIGAFLEGVSRLRAEAAQYGMKIYEGAEIRFDENENDYLVYGFHRELLADPDAVMRMGLQAFSERCRADGALLIQAHPFRKCCTPADPACLDGVEVLNKSPRHESRNDLARAYAEQHGLLMTAGSDCHRPEDIAASGILTDTLPEDSFALAALLRTGKYTLIE